MTLMEARRSPSYNCAHFLCDAWEEETGQDIRGPMGCFLLPRGLRSADSTLVRTMQRLTTPTDPCVVVLRPRRGAVHVGMYVRRRVFHLGASGPVRQVLGLATVGFSSVRFYAPR